MLRGWDPQAERRARELLYRCLEELGATKAALYLEGSEGAFELVAQYGFGRRDAIAAELKPGHPLLDWTRRHRTVPAFLNEAAGDAGLGPLLEGAGSSRLLTIPLTVVGRLVGLVDARDKARKLPYGPEDVPAARAIGTAIEGFVREIGLYAPAEPAPVPAAPAVAAPAPEPRGVPSLHTAVIESLTGTVRTLAGMPGIATLALTVTDGRAVRCLALRSTALDAQQREALAAHQMQRLVTTGVRLPPASRWGWDEVDSGGGERRAEAVWTALLHEGPPVWVVASVMAPRESDAGTRALAIVQAHFAQANALRAYRRAARGLARTLLEPGEASYPHLKQHSQAVSELAQRIAAGLGLSEDEEELVTVAGWLHDVGMRELDYARVYRMERPGEPERRMFQRHATLGARILEAADFPGDLAGAVRHHHERFDGAGYPQRLSGRAIPLASRIVHVAEVWDVLTSQGSYKRPIARELALDTIRSESSRQFDPDVVRVLEELVKP